MRRNAVQNSKFVAKTDLQTFAKFRNKAGKSNGWSVRKEAFRSGCPSFVAQSPEGMPEATEVGGRMLITWASWSPFNSQLREEKNAKSMLQCKVSVRCGME